MSPSARKKRTRTRPSTGTGQRIKHRAKTHKPLQIPDDRLREKYFERFVIGLLLGFGIYISVLYFGHQVVPNSDFTAFVSVAEELLDFKVPSSFKRVPMLGFMQVGLSKFVGGRHPELTAGWLLNAMLYPLILVLVYLVARRVIGKPAIWFAVLAIINPWTIKWMRHPVAETALIFFIVLTIYFILRRSRWCYLFAAMTTMIRYEGAALILAAFVMDIIESRSWKPRFKALFYSIVAGIPMSVWMVGMYLNRKTGTTVTSMPYIKYYGKKTVFAKCTELMWNVSARPLVIPVPGNQDMTSLFLVLGKILLVACLAAAVIYMVYKRQWHVLPLVIFLTCYYFVHASKAGVIPRYCVPVAWIIVLLACYGLRGIWLMMPGKKSIPRPVVVLLQLIAAAGGVICCLWLVRYLPYIAGQSQRSTSLPYCAMGVVILMLTGYCFAYKTRYLSANIAMAAITLLLIVSNQFSLVPTVRNGSMDLEFKKLANWYVAHAKPEEKMVTTMQHVVSLYAPEYEKYFIKASRITGKSPTAFVKNCYKRGITYVAWDSRIGLNTKDSYYSRWRIKNMAMLSKPRSIGPFKFIDEIRHEHYPYRYIYIFRMEPLTKPENKP